MASVISAMPPMITRIALITANSLTNVSLTHRMMKNTSRRPMVRLTARKSRVPMTLCASDIASTAPCIARLKMIETMIQPMLSSMMADARITCPTKRRMKFISCTTMATILTEAIDNAVPRNRAVIRRLPGSGSMDSGINSPRATPHTKGTTMPMSEAKAAARPVWRTSLRSVSMPVSSSRSRTPNCETASIIAFCSGFLGNKAC